MSDGMTEAFLEEARQRSPGLKFDAGKPPMELLDRYAMEEIAKVLQFGASKYGRDNWRNDIQVSRLIGAALRHIYAYADGEVFDPESGLPHLAHAGCCVMFCLWMHANRPEFDDRWSRQQLRKVLDAYEPAPGGTP